MRRPIAPGAYGSAHTPLQRRQAGRTTNPEPRSPRLNPDAVQQDSANAIPNYWVRLNDFAALALGLMMFVEIEIGGRLYSTEVVFLILIPFLLITRLERVITWFPMTVAILGLAWLGSQYASNSVSVVFEEDRVRVYARILFLVINFLTIYLLFYESKYRLLIFAVGVGIGWGTSVVVNPVTEFEILDPWKFGGADSAMVAMGGLVGLYMYARRQPSLIPALGYIALSAVSLYLVVRNSAGISALTGVTLLLWYMNARRRAASLPSLSRLGTLSVLSVLILAAGLTVTSVYGTLAESGALGDGARKKYEMQTSNELGLISGRSEFLASVPAIMDSPILGYGASRNAPGYMAEYLARKAQLGMLVGKESAGRDTVTAHSYLFGSWLEAGILGGLFWIFSFVMAAYVISIASTWASFLVPLTILGCFKLLWDIAFSPLGAEARVIVPLFLSLIGYAVLSRSGREGAREAGANGSARARS